jgi:hypothetical protein
MHSSLQWRYGFRLALAVLPAVLVFGSVLAQPSHDEQYSGRKKR